MAAMSNWLETQLLSHILGSGTYTKPSTIALALCNIVPNSGDMSLSGKEVANSNAYARQALNPSASNWLDPAQNGMSDNLVGVSWPTANGGDWGWISGVAIVDSTSYGGGHMLFFGALTTPKLIGNLDQFKMNSGDCSLTLS